MSENLRWYPTNAGADSKPVVWKLEGGQALWLAGACAIGIGLFRLLIGTLDWSLMIALAISSIPPLVTVTFLLKFVTGKPKSHAADFLEWQSHKLKGLLAGFGVSIRPRALISREQNVPSSEIL